MAEKSVENARRGKDFAIIIGGVLLLFFFFLGLVVVAFLVPERAGFPAPGIAIIPVKGEITSSNGSFGSGAGSDDIAAFIDEADNNPAVGAILLDIDSPGGEVVPSKQIVYKVRSVSKPVYSYINSMGTSGAYYVASASDYIMADEDSITGSIGVISIFYNLEELLGNAGIEVTILKEGDFKAIGSPFRGLTEEEEIIRGILSGVHEGFKEDVLEFRGGRVTRAELEKVADGRIISGRQARVSGLVDELVSKEGAFERAAELAGIENPVRISYGKRKLTLAELFFSAGREFGLGFSGSLRPGYSVSIR